MVDGNVEIQSFYGTEDTGTADVGDGTDTCRTGARCTGYDELGGNGTLALEGNVHGSNGDVEAN